MRPGVISLSSTERTGTRPTRRIEARDRIAEKLKLNEAKLRKASELVGLAVYSWDPVNDVVECDDCLRAMWGMIAGEPVDRAMLLDAIHPGDRARVDAAITASLDPSGDGRYDIEYRVTGRSDGVERWIATSAQTTFEGGMAVGFIGAAVDVSDKRLAEAAIHASEARFRSFAHYSANLLWIVNPATNIIEYLSPAYERIWGESIKEAPNAVEDWLKRVHPDDLNSVRIAFKAVRRGEQVHHEYRIIRPDGSVRWVRDTSFPIRRDEGQVARIAGIAEDLTLCHGNQVYMIAKLGEKSALLANMLRNAGFQVRLFGSCWTLLDIAAALLPGCILVDLRQGAQDVIEVTRELKARSILLPTVVIGAEVADPASIVAAMKAGAADYLISPFDDAALTSALASAMAQMHGWNRVQSDAAEAATRVAHLTPRERSVLEGVIDGGTNKIIAKKLQISHRTVEAYRSKLMNRLGAANMSELIQIAVAAGVRPQMTHLSAGQ